LYSRFRGEKKEEEHEEEKKEDMEEQHDPQSQAPQRQEMPVSEMNLDNGKHEE